MAVKRIVTNIQASDPGLAKAFYGDILGMDLVMDHGWIITYASDQPAAPQLSIATEGGSGTEVPDISIEVDDLDAVHRKILKARISIEYGRFGNLGGCAASTSVIPLEGFLTS